MASFSVVSNIASANAQANLSSTNIGLNKALTRLSSGFRINYSGDDAAGLAVANAYRNEVAVLNQGIRNANDGLSQLQIKDGALANISTLLDRLATLASQASSTSNGVDIGKLSDEYGEIVTEITREATVGGLNASSSFSVFISSETTVANGVITEASIGATGATGLGLTTTSFADATTAQTALGQVTAAIDTLGDVQNTIGTLQNKLQFAISLSQSQVVNTRAAESRIRDANVAEEAANMTRFNILSQSGIAALAQANQASSSVLSLLR
jgi:flagellin